MHIFLIITLALIVPYIFAAPIDDDESLSSWRVDEEPDLFDEFSDPVAECLDNLHDVQLEDALAIRLFGARVSTTEAISIMNSAVSLLHNPQEYTGRRNPTHMFARRLLRFMTGENHIELTASSSQEDSREIDPDYCVEDDPDQQSAVARRQVSHRTMHIIINMHDAGASERTIQAKYKWFRRRKIADFRRCLASAGQTRPKMDTIADHVHQRAIATRRADCQREACLCGPKKVR